MDRDTGTSVHANLGMFVLVLMSHGDNGSISAKSHYESIHLEDIYKLLSSQNFPVMRGRPKMVILQTCSGGYVKHFHFMSMLFAYIKLIYMMND